MRIINSTQWISQVGTNNCFYNLPYTKDKLRCEITREDGETFSPQAGKGWCDLHTVYDLFPDPTDEQIKIFHDDWMKELYTEDPEKKNDNLNKFIEACAE